MLASMSAVVTSAAVYSVTKTSAPIDRRVKIIGNQPSGLSSGRANEMRALCRKLFWNIVLYEVRYCEWLECDRCVPFVLVFVFICLQDGLNVMIQTDQRLVRRQADVAFLFQHFGQHFCSWKDLCELFLFFWYFAASKTLWKTLCNGMTISMRRWSTFLLVSTGKTTFDLHCNAD